MDGYAKGHMELGRFSQPLKQAPPQQQSLHHRIPAQMDGIGVPGGPGKSPQLFCRKTAPGPIALQAAFSWFS